jgi:hypothetical protein
MKTADWEKEHGYTKEQKCDYCKHSTLHDFAYKRWHECREREKAGAKAKISGNGWCDLWEHE